MGKQDCRSRRRIGEMRSADELGGLAKEHRSARAHMRLTIPLYAAASRWAPWSTMPLLFSERTDGSSSIAFCEIAGRQRG